MSNDADLPMPTTRPPLSPAHKAIKAEARLLSDVEKARNQAAEAQRKAEAAQNKLTDALEKLKNYFHVKHGG